VCELKRGGFQREAPTIFTTIFGECPMFEKIIRMEPIKVGKRKKETLGAPSINK
jgi:hypothetical protein